MSFKADFKYIMTMTFDANAYWWSETFVVIYTLQEFAFWATATDEWTDSRTDWIYYILSTLLLKKTVILNVCVPWFGMFFIKKLFHKYHTITVRHKTRYASWCNIVIIGTFYTFHCSFDRFFYNKIIEHTIMFLYHYLRLQKTHH